MRTAMSIVSAFRPRGNVGVGLLRVRSAPV